MTNDEGHKPEGAPSSPEAGADAPSGVDENGPKRFSVQGKMAIAARRAAGSVGSTNECVRRQADRVARSRAASDFDHGRGRLSRTNLCRCRPRATATKSTRDCNAQNARRLPYKTKAPCGALAILPSHTASFAAFTGRALMTFRAGLALNSIGSLVKGLMPLRALVAGFLMTTNFAKPGTKKAPVFLSSL
jgi:hypothetical protein